MLVECLLVIWDQIFFNSTYFVRSPDCFRNPLWGLNFGRGALNRTNLFWDLLLRSDPTWSDQMETVRLIESRFATQILYEIMYSPYVKLRYNLKMT